MKNFAYSAIILLLLLTNSALALELLSQKAIEKTPYASLIHDMIAQAKHNYWTQVIEAAEREPFDVTQLEGRVGQTVKVPMVSANFGQPNVDFFNFYVKSKLAFEDDLVKWRPKKKVYDLLSKSGTTVFEKTKPGKAVVIGDRLYLHDGNTKFLTSWLFGATEYWVEITGYYPEASVHDPEFMSRLEQHGKILLYNAQGERVAVPPGVDEIEDIPIRAHVLAHRISADIEALHDPEFVMDKDFFDNFKKHLEYKGDPNFESAVFAKINGEPSFVEFLLAVAAHLGGYNPPQAIDEYETKKRHTEYLIDSIQRGLILDHGVSKRLQELVTVPLVSHHGVFPEEKDFTGFLKNHYKRRANFDKFSCSEEL
ncbi:MAG: hypothetical protein AAF202_01095 [Pseudomonadota bacterium]